MARVKDPYYTERNRRRALAARQSHAKSAPKRSAEKSAEARGGSSDTTDAEKIEAVLVDVSFRKSAAQKRAEEETARQARRVQELERELAETARALELANEARAEVETRHKSETRRSGDREYKMAGMLKYIFSNARYSGRRCDELVRTIRRVERDFNEFF